MKNKPVSHKNLNAFRFQTFAERISSINIDIIHQINRVNTPLDETKTYFGEAFDKWLDLNFTVDYEKLRKDVGVEIQTLAQILFRKDDLIEILLQHLCKEESLALDAILELTVALARDLESEFYPCFPKFFSAITLHLSTKDTDLLERLFTCLAYLFKFLWRYMVDDMENVYRMFSSLLSNSKEHIRIFAVESFAFLVRRVQDKERLFILMFSELEQNPEQYLGVGQLLFEVIKGVKEKFHSCTEKVLPLLLKFLGNMSCPLHLIEQALEHMMTCMAKHTVKEHCFIMQNIFCNFIKELLLKLDSIEEDKEIVAHLDRVLRLFLFWINIKNGKLISSTAAESKSENSIVKILMQLSDLKNLPNYCMKSIADIISSVMISSCVELPLDVMRNAITKIYSHSEELVFYFTRNMYKYGMFEKDLLPALMKECLNMVEESNPEKQSKVLEILSETVITLKPLTLNAEDVESFSKLYFYASSETLKREKQLACFDTLEDLFLQSLQCHIITKEKLSEIWSALVCLPHLRLINKAHACEVIQKLSRNLHTYLLNSELSKDLEIEEYAFVLLNAYFVSLIIERNENEENCFTTNFVLELLTKFPASISLLQMLDLHLGTLKKLPVLDNTNDVLSAIITNLSSPYHMVRLCTLKLLNTLNIHCDENQKRVTLTVLNICYEAEKVPLDVQSYREKLNWLRKLEYDFIEKEIPLGLESILIKVPIQYLLGMLYVNFKLLWDPSIALLKSFAHGKTKILWEVFYPHLENIINLCEEYNSGVPISKYEWENNDSTFHEIMKSFYELNEKPDLLNHRLLLWKALEHFPDVAESKNRAVVPLLFQFMTKEVNKVETLMATTENINKNQTAINVSAAFDLEFDDVNKIGSQSKKRKRKEGKFIGKKRSKIEESLVEEKIENDQTASLDPDKEMSELVSNELELDDQKESEDYSDDEPDVQEDDQEATIVEPNKKINYAKKKHHIAKTLAAYLSVFAKFKNPKGGYGVNELEDLYKELLCYYDPVIQRLAFDCILTFSYKYLTPYKENFYRILDNKTFKSEVVLFSLDTQNEVIQEEHRMNTLTILMRILYGKMIHKTGNNTTGRAQANTRRSLVLRFLAGCKAEELKLFFELVFLPFKDQLKDDTLSAVKKIRNSIDLSSIVPIRRQHSALNTLGLILQHLGNLVPELLPWLLKVLLIITATSTTLLEKREEVLPQCINVLKSVRVLAVVKLIQFFQTFKEYEFTPIEIDAVFDSIVWPMLPRLKLESVNQPSPLLRLLSSWSDNKRYFILFAKHHEDSASLTPLPHIMDLYCSSQAKSRVVGAISKIIFQLLSAEDAVPDEEEKKLLPLLINFPLPLTNMPNMDVNFGTQLLLPYIEKILIRFEMTATSLAKRKIKKSISPRDLNILLKISSFVEDSMLCFKLIHLLTPFLLKPKLDHDSEVLILNNIANLIRISTTPDYFIKLFAPLFGKLLNQNSRSALVAVFSAMAERPDMKNEEIKPAMQELANIVSMVNAFDENIVEEPDYEQRLDGHKEALNVIRSMTSQTFNDNFIRIIIFNSSYAIRNISDIALRNNATYVLQEITRLLSSFMNSLPDIVKMLLFDTLLPEVQKGLKSSTESVRHEFIQILSTVLQNYKQHPSFKDLVILCHEDRELDFWENIRHLQVHRRARALLRLANILRDSGAKEENNSVHYLLTYMIPIVTSFLFDPSYKKHVHVIDAAIETLGCIAHVLPWHHYEPLLKQYLVLLLKDAENHKTIVKIIVSLLNAFHFDLSKQDLTPPPEESEILSTAVPVEEISAMDTTIAENDVNVIDTSISAKPLVYKHRQTSIDKIHGAIRRNILPLLHRSLMKKNKVDIEHKLSGHYFPEDEDILRVPVALAMVKLLQRLPSGTLEKNLPGLFLKMCDLLKSRTETIRGTSRDTLIKMMQSLGPKHFRCLLTEMKGVMKRGYQVHVMIYTINAVLTSIVDQMKPSDLDQCVKDLTEICINELFSDSAEEKEVAKITGKLKEARTFKSYSIFQVISKYISEQHLLELILPLKEALAKKHSHKIMKKVSECLRHIALGLSENKGLSSKSQLQFIYAIINESVPGLNLKKKHTVTKSVKYERPDIYLVPKEPGRSGPPAKINEKSTAHILVQFGLQIFQFSLKKDKIEKNEKEILQMLDPFVPLLADCLQSNHIKIITTALRCLMPLYKYPLPAFKTVTKKFVESLFILINKYAAVGMGQGDNFEMIVMCFKVFTTLLRDSDYHKMNEEQIQSLLSYIEQDIYDHTRQATAFTLLKAILSKKLQAPGLKGIMSKVAEMAITAEQDYIRAQCRQACLQYMLDYPLGKQLQKPMSFFIGQLEYHLEPGRVSALEIINSMITTFPENILKKHSALFLIPLAARLVNDESPGCRKMSAQCIKKLLTKVEHDGRLSLFSITFTWLQADKVSHKRLGAQLCGMFAEVEGENFEHHMHQILPVVTDLIMTYKTIEVKTNTDERCSDHFLFHVLNALAKMLSFCPIIKKEEFSENLNLLWGTLQGLILHPHVWVRLATCQLFGLLLAAYTVEEIQNAICDSDNELIYLNTRQKLRDLSADFCTQLQSPYLNEKLGEQIIRNLVYLAKVISSLPQEMDAESTSEVNEVEDNSVQVSLDWIIRRLCREAKKEVAEQPNNSQRRKCIFMFMAAIANELGKEKLLPILKNMLFPLCREISDNSNNTDESLKKVSQEVLDMIQSVVGVDNFTTIYASVQSFLHKKRATRRQDRAKEAVTDPQKFAQKRIKRQKSKKESKKRKIMKIKGKRKVSKKKSKLSDLVIG